MAVRKLKKEEKHMYDRLKEIASVLWPKELSVIVQKRRSLEMPSSLHLERVKDGLR